MAGPCADTSFLFALYGDDAHSSTARAWVARHAATLPVASYAAFELANALRCAEFRKLVALDDARASLAAFRRDTDAGLIRLITPNAGDVLTEAERLSSRHSASGGFRSFDILIVASAVVMRASLFLSFDSRQRQLARLAKLAIAPEI